MSDNDLDRVAAAIEADAGESIPGLRESLAEMASDHRARSYTPEQLALREARGALGLSQPAFARLLRTPVGTVRDWEQGRFAPPGSAVLVAQLAVEHPEVMREYVEKSERQSADRVSAETT
jgi:putative transcriptional regulator